MSYKSRLKQMREQWNVGKKGFPKIDAGVYAMQLAGAELTESSGGNLMIKRQHLVIDGEFSGEIVRDNMMLHTDTSMRFVAMWIEQMGFEVPENPEEIEDVLEEMVNAAPTYTAKLEWKDDFANIRIQELIDDVERPPIEDAGDADDDATITVSAFSKGDAVKFEDDDGNIVVGKIESVDGAAATVISEDDEEWQDIPLDMLTAADADDGGEEEDPDELTKLLAFAQSQDIEDGITDDMSVEDLVAVLNEYEWEEAELTEDEVALLDAHGIKYKPKPKPKTAKKTRGRSRAKK